MRTNALTVLFSALLFGSWFKKYQLDLVDPGLAGVYPHAWWAVSLALTALFFLLAWRSLVFASRSVIRDASESVLSRHHALPFLVFALVPFGAPVRLCTGLFLAAQASVLALHLSRQRTAADKGFQADLLALVVMAAVYTYGFSFFSPVYWEEPLVSYVMNLRGASGNIPPSSPLHKTGYIAAKFASFSELDPSYWGGVARPLTGLYSLAMPIAVFFLDLPAIDVETFHRLIFQMTWLACVLGSFGFYLFLSRGAGLPYVLSLAGGALFVYSNQYFCRTFVLDFPAFHLYFLFLPYPMWLAVEALKRRSYRPAAGAGLCLALPFYVMAPHPQAVLLGVTFFSLFLVFLLAFHRADASFKIRAAVLLGVVAALAALAYLAPAFESIFRGELAYFGHKEPVQPVRWAEIVKPENLLVVLSLAVIAFLKKDAPEGEGARRAVFWTFVALSVALALLYIPEVRHWIGRQTGIFASRQNATRLRGYYSLCALTLVLFALDAAFFRRTQGPALRRIFGGFAAGVAACFILYLASYGLRAMQGGRALNGVPEDSSPRILVATMAAHLKGLERDAASARFVREKLARLEDSILAVDSSRDIYREYLRSLGVESVRGVPLDGVAALAAKVAGPFDDFDAKRDPSPYPWGRPSDQSGNQITHYNYAGTLAAARPLERVVFATGDDLNIGLSGGLLINNTLTGIDGRYMMGYPPMHFLYYHPGADFYGMGIGGFLSGLAGWRIHAGEALMEDNRKLLDIAGIDILVVDGPGYSITRHDDTELLPYVLPAGQDPQYAVLRNQRSYGLAYWAGSVRYESPAAMREAAAHFQPPFYERDPVHYMKFRRALTKLRDSLVSLEGPRAVILEDDEKAGRTETKEAQGNAVLSAGFIGDRAAFGVRAAQPGLFVFNTAALHGWRAFADAREVPVRRVNYAFVAAEVPAGARLVWFEHRPILSIFAAFASLLTYIGVLTAWIHRPEARHS